MVYNGGRWMVGDKGGGGMVGMWVTMEGGGIVVTREGDLWDGG